ncbi:multicopper oxidase family protein [Glaciihabitans sp. UYNi722]|uniref:multicopper oxidase family protein n=1 Tax=Glaciihabitans sp. UYNi722 TaxID=3156344 RepID=UPI00339A85DE
MDPISRRTALTLGGVGGALVLAGGAGLVWDWSTTGQSTSPSTPSPSGKMLTQPELIRSANGLLEVALTASRSPITISGTTVDALSYNGSLPGPTLLVHPGDTIKVALANRLDDPTNLHTHGLHVSPEGSSDNVLRRIDAGTTADYRYEIPADHPPGAFWYHPHHHGMAAAQVFGGLYGAIIVEDPTPIPATTERVLIVSDITFDASGTIAVASQMDRMSGREGTTVLLNGQVGATMNAHPGDRERWRIINACTSRYLDLRLDGQTLHLLGNDSGRFATPRRVDSLTLMPGNRADVLVTLAAGTSVLQAHPVDRGTPAGMMGGNTQSGDTATLATVHVSGAEPTTSFPPPPTSSPRDIRSQPIAGKRTLTFAMGGSGMGGSTMGFTIDGRGFDASRVDQTVAAGTVEEWTIVNTSPMDHPFHLHVWPMQVIEIGGNASLTPTWQDVVNVPAHSRSRVRIAFEDFTGTTVYHCHILDHEDNGMMGIITVS